MTSLLGRAELIKTSDLDQADWNFRPVLGAIQRRRFTLVARALDADSRRVDRLLEIGYGSGVFAPELAARCTHLLGVDVHPSHAEVTAVLAARGIDADLRQAHAEALPFDDASIDTAVAVSSLEFVDDIGRVAAEVRRVLVPGGRFVVVTPGYSPALDLGLRLLTGERAEDTFQGRRQAVIPALSDAFVVEHQQRFPPVPRLWLYSVLSLRRGNS